MAPDTLGEGLDGVKLQVTKGYAPQFGQLSRLLNYVGSRADSSRLGSAEIIEGTGLSKPHVINMSSIAVAMGLLLPRVLRLTDAGRLVTRHDPFFDDLGTLWFCHYLIASNPRHLVWNRLANDILPAARGPVSLEPSVRFADLEDAYTATTVHKHVPKEVRSFVRAYTVHRFRKLDYLLEQSGRYCLADEPAPVPPLILLLTIITYRDAAQPRASGMEIPLICEGDNSPGRILHLTTWRLRRMLEGLRQRGEIEIESRANLDQVRFRSAATPTELLARYYEER